MSSVSRAPCFCRIAYMIFSLSVSVGAVFAGLGSSSNVNVSCLLPVISSINSFTLVKTLAPSPKSLFVPLLTSSVIRPGIDQTSRPSSSAACAVNIAPPPSGDSATTTRDAMPTMIRLRCGKCQASPPTPIGNSEISAPLSRILMNKSLFSCGYTLSIPVPKTAIVTPFSAKQPL